MKKSLRETGFTIVELLVVVVVISILATISTVTYNGVTSRTADVALVTDAKSLEKLIRVEMLTDGTDVFINEPVTEQEFLQDAGLTQMSDRLYLTDYEVGPVDETAKTKIYLAIFSDETIFWSYWSNSDGQWKHTSMYLSSGEIWDQSLSNDPLPAP